MTAMNEVLLQGLWLSSASTGSPFRLSAENGVDGDSLQTNPTELNPSPNCFSSNQKLESRVEGGREEEEGGTLSLLALLVTVFRKSMVACRTEGRAEEASSKTEGRAKEANSKTEGSAEEASSGMEIGVPTDVKHVAHVTFDRFHGFLGLPHEFEQDVPRVAPSASASVFGVSPESMQCSICPKGYSIPTILLQLQKKMYAQGGLQAEGIFRINAENSQAEYLREQLNKGIVPDGVDVHCLAGLIKAWFRELPKGVLDSLSAEQVMRSNTEEECVRLVKLLPSTEASLLDWALNLMADVAQEERLNKMNARNVALVFAPNMTQMADPLTALMYAVQVMNFLKTLILKTLRERHEATVRSADPPSSSSESKFSDRNDPQNLSHSSLSTVTKEDHQQEEVFYSIVERG